MQDIFSYRDEVINEYKSFSRSFTNISAPDIKSVVDKEYDEGRYWPDPLIQINPNYKTEKNINELCDDGTLENECRQIFQADKKEDGSGGKTMTLYTHQQEAIALAAMKQSYVVTTGTGSGKSLAFFIPIVNEILKNRANNKGRTSAIIIYPMNALANSQLEEIKKFLRGYDEGEEPFTVGQYTGQESEAERQQIADNPPDILLTNFMMMELLLTRGTPNDKTVMKNCDGLQFLVLDELHTYRGRQGADVALLVRRLRQKTRSQNLVCIGTSATMSNQGNENDQNFSVAQVASKLFGTTISPNNVIGETLSQSTDQKYNLETVKPLLLNRIKKSTPDYKDLDEFLNDPLSVTDGIDWQKVYASKDLSKAVFEVAEKLCPKYLISWRNITNATSERSVIASVLPFCGVGNSGAVANISTSISTVQKSCLLANFDTISFEFIARMKIGGTNFNFFIVNQLPVLSPKSYSQADVSFIVPRVMALTYTANDMTEWEKALCNDSSLKIRLKMLQLNDDRNAGITDEKFVDREFNSAFLPSYIYDDAKCAVLRAELGSYFSRLYGITRSELQYILDPQSVMGEDYPSETFRVLKDNEIAKYGEYRTQRLVLEAWDRME